MVLKWDYHHSGNINIALGGTATLLEEVMVNKQISG